MQQDVYLDFLWACDQLTDKGDPKTGYGPKKK